VQDLPRNIDAERALLSAFMLDRKQYERLRGRITVDVFTHEMHLLVAKAIDVLYQTGAEFAPVTILSEIDRNGSDSARFRGSGGVGLLGELTIAGIPSKAAGSYLKLLEESAQKRSILRATEELASLARNGADVTDLARVFQTYSRRMETLLSTAEGIRTVDVLDALQSSLPPVPWIADGWLGEGDLVIFGGEWASGKSLIALDLAISVATGIHWMGRIPITKTGPVLYVDEENNARNVTRRISRMVRGRNIDPEIASAIPLRYLSKNHLRLDAPRGLSTLRAEIEAHRPVLVVLDSLIRFHGADENSNTEMAALFGEAIVPLATKYNVAFVVLDHMRKPSKEDQQFDQGHRVRGAGDKAGVGDGMWTVHGDRDTDSRTFSCRKNRWEDSLPPAMTTKWCTSEDESAAWLECQDATVSSEVRRITAEIAIPKILENHPRGLTATDLYERAAAATAAPKRTLQRVVKRLVSDGEIQSRKEPYRKVRYWVGTLEEGLFDV
jgi:hypothetical protein